MELLKIKRIFRLIQFIALKEEEDGFPTGDQCLRILAECWRVAANTSLSVLAPHATAKLRCIFTHLQSHISLSLDFLYLLRVKNLFSFDYFSPYQHIYRRTMSWRELYLLT